MTNNQTKPTYHGLTGRLPDPAPRADEQGFVLLLAMVAAVIPLVLILGATSQSMQGRLSRLEHEIEDERTLLAAESGIDAAIYVSSTSSGLSSGVSFSRTFADGSSYTVTPTYLRSDHIDNDGDASIDEADEDVFQVLVVGSYKNDERRLVAYLGPETPPVPPVSMPSAVYVTKIPAGQELHIQGASNIDGHDRNINGSAATGPAMPGVSAKSPATLAQLTNLIPPADRGKVLGAGASPSLGITATAVDFNAIKLQIQNSANTVLTSGSYNNLQFGNGSTNNFRVIYRNGAVQFSGNTRGAGLMFINGSLHVEGTFRFDGIIYVTGDVEIHGTSTINGAVVTGASCPHFYLEGTSHVYYSSEAISRANNTSPTRYLAFNGWQEIARY